MKIPNIPQTIYKFCFNISFKATRHINEKIRNGIVIVCLFVLVSLYFVQNAKNALQFYVFDTIDRSIVGGIAILILCIFSVNAPLEKVKWNKWLMYTYYLAAIYMTLMSFHHSPGRGYKIFAILFLVAFPAIYFVWNNRKDYETYYNWFAKAIVVSGSITIVLTYLLRPINSDTIIDGRYVGLTSDAGMFGLSCVIITTATLYLIAKKSKGLWFYLLITGISTSFVWLGGTRTSIIIVFCQLVAWAIMFIRISPKETKKKVVATIMITLCVVIIAVPVITSSLKLAGEYVSFSFAEEPENPLDRFDRDDKNIDDFSSGRIFLWKYYLKELTWTGNDATNHKIITPSGQELHNAHNAYLEIAYRFGIPAGVFFLLFMLGVCVIMIKTIFSGRKDYFTIFFVLASIAYGIGSMLDAQTHPFTRGPVLIFYLALVMAFNNTRNEKTAN